jgi:hypothetical protein
MYKSQPREEKMHVLAIGQPFDPSITQWSEGCHYNYDGSGHWLHYLYHEPSTVEVTSIQSGEAQFGLYVHGPLIFLLHQFGNMPWNDAAYSWWRVSEEPRQLPEVDGGYHALLKVVMVDTATGLVAALRALTFSAEFTEELHRAIRHQAEQSWNLGDYDSAVREIYSKFSTNDLVDRAQAFCKGGD